MAANGISTLANKKLRQDTKLAKALAKREGKTVAADGTISGATDTNAKSYRARNTLDATQLPTRYKTDNTLDDNANADGLVVGRPWTT
jgi:hypothetical protein|tara:strand:- start:2134 stop:2397 length:264 start_codon:yes stop_codon:yes gene_type:complete